MATGFFLHSSFAALQDVATEALALDVIPVAEMGRLNGVMMAAKVLGKGLGAAALAFVIHTKGFRAAVITQIVLLLLIALLPLMVRERPGERILAWAIGPSDDIVPKHSLGQFFRTLTSSLLEWPVMSLLLLGCIASVGEEIVDVVTKPFYIKQLGWTYLQYSNVSGWAAVPIILGSLLGGWAADKLGCKRVIVIGFLTYGLLAISFGSLPLGSSNGWSATLFLLSESATTTFGSVAFFAIAMRISSGRLAVTVFSTLLASATLGHVIGDLMMSIFRGRLHWTYQTLLVFGGTLMIISLLLLRSVRERNTMLLTEPV
jgi:PAT family beta-lactamase induction signal transducer AmpG